MTILTASDIYFCDIRYGAITRVSISKLYLHFILLCSYIYFSICTCNVGTWLCKTFESIHYFKNIFLCMPNSCSLNPCLSLYTTVPPSLLFSCECTATHPISTAVVVETAFDSQCRHPQCASRDACIPDPSFRP